MLLFDGNSEGLFVPVHVDATDLYETVEAGLEEEMRHRQELVFLPLDLIGGRVGPHHGLWSWLIGLGAGVAELEWFQAHALALPGIGINLYPMFSQKLLERSAGGIRIRMPYAKASIVERLAALYWERYRCPLFIAETAATGSVRRQRDWLVDSVAAVGRVRARGIPLVGYTWWPLFALVTWGYRQGRKDVSYYLRQMGLWDLESDSVTGLKRVRTPLVDLYRGYVAGGIERVGEIGIYKR